MAGLVPAIHVFAVAHKKTWMPGINPGMTEESMRMNLYSVFKRSGDRFALSNVRHGRTCSGHPRLCGGSQDVDARDKPGHDEGGHANESLPSSGRRRGPSDAAEMGE